MGALPPLALLVLAVCCGLARTRAEYAFCSGDTSYTPPPRGQPPAPLLLLDDQFVTTTDNTTVHLKAYNWFGFNNGQTSLDGLWAGGNAAHSDMATITYQLRVLGFNAVRLPFLFKDLSAQPIPRASYCSPVDEAYLRQRTVDPQLANAATNSTFPPPAAPLPKVGGSDMCNTYLPSSSTLDRYLWTIQWFAANNMYVLVDYHPMGLEWVQNDLDDFVSAWRAVWGAIACLPNFEDDLRGRVFVDIMNEPDSVGVRWEPSSNVRGSSPGINSLYHETMEALWDMTPGAVIFFIEGGGQTGLQNTNWGNGFATDPKVVRDNGLSDPNPFFKKLMASPYRRHVVISPHVYGPSVTNSPGNWAGPGLFKVLDITFGYLTRKGYCLDGDCQRFPVAIGEFGSRFLDPRDLQHLNDFALYLNAQGAGDTNGHNAIGNWMYWSWNANSGDTGGLIDDKWRDLMWIKIRFLVDKLGLKPWYLA